MVKGLMMLLTSLGMSSCSHSSLDYGVEFTKYINIFVEEALKRGVILDSARFPIEIKLDVLPDDYYGVCHYGEKIIINNKYWEGLPPDCKEELMFHEMGHCILKKSHSEDSRDIMYGYMTTRYSCKWYHDNKKQMLDVYFGRAK